MPWEDNTSPSDGNVEWISDEEYRDFLKGQYINFGFWYFPIFMMSLISTYALITQYYDYGHISSQASDVAVILMLFLFLENYSRLILYASEWILRWFGSVGKIANWLMWYSVKLLRPFQIATGFGLALMLTYSAIENSEPYWYVVASYGLWNWVVTKYRDNVLEYLAILRAEAYKPIFD